MSEKAVQTVPTPVTSNGFSTIGDTFNKAFAILKLSWVNLLLVSIITWISMFVVGILGGLALFGSILGPSFGALMKNPDQSEKIFETALPQMLATGAITIPIFIFILVLISLLFSSSMLASVIKAEEKPGLGEIFKIGGKMFLPLLLTSFISGFLTFGGFMLFVMPGVIMALFFVFAQYEVVSQKSKYLTALRRSTQMVTQNFGAVFARLAIVFLLSFGINWAFQIIGFLIGLGGDNTSSLGLVYSFVIQFFTVVYSWFVMAYMFTVYREAIVKTDFDKKSSTVWMWIVAVIGWILGIIFWGMIIAALAMFAGSSTVKDAIQTEMSTELQQDGNTQYDINTMIETNGQDLSPAEKALLKQALEDAQRAQLQDTQDATRQ